jgi:predicted NAD/FAD-binding protein
LTLKGQKLRVAVVGTGIAGMSAAWLLDQTHDVVVYEQAHRLGGHSHTIDIPGVYGRDTAPVDMGFIVYNPETYPNLTALFRHLGVPTKPSDMSFSASLRGGALEYGGASLGSLFAQPGNLLSPRFWSMLRDLVRFYRKASQDACGTTPDSRSLGEYLSDNRYGEALVRDHLLPMAAAIWSTPAQSMIDHPAEAFLRFCHNHGLLRLFDRPQWRTVIGGSRTYVSRLTASFADRIRLGCGARSVRRRPDGVLIVDADGHGASYDHVVIATHADQALRLLEDPLDTETKLLGAIAYRDNDAVMHRDRTLMPRRRRVWSSWNYIGGGPDDGGSLCATYWMNRLQSLHDDAPVFVTLNPAHPPSPTSIIHRETYAHPQFDLSAMAAQRQLWSLQGIRRTWYCGAYFGAGFHEDGLQAGLAVAEALGGARRPWRVPDESSRIALAPAAASWAIAA